MEEYVDSQHFQFRDLHIQTCLLSLYPVKMYFMLWKLSWNTLLFSAAVAVFNKGTRLFFSMHHAWTAEAPVWITWRTPVLLELRGWLFSLDISDHRESVCHSMCVWRLCRGQNGDSGGHRIHWRHSLDPGWERWKNAGLPWSTWGAVFIPCDVGWLCCSWVSWRLCVLLKADRQREKDLTNFCTDFRINKVSVSEQRGLWETEF